MKQYKNNEQIKTIGFKLEAPFLNGSIMIKLFGASMASINLFNLRKLQELGQIRMCCNE